MTRKWHFIGAFNTHAEALKLTLNSSHCVSFSVSTCAWISAISQISGDIQPLPAMWPLCLIGTLHHGRKSGGISLRSDVFLLLELWCSLVNPRHHANPLLCLPAVSCYLLPLAWKLFNNKQCLDFVWMNQIHIHINANISWRWHIYLPDIPTWQLWEDYSLVLVNKITSYTIYLYFVDSVHRPYFRQFVYPRPHRFSYFI